MRSMEESEKKKLEEVVKGQPLNDVEREGWGVWKKRDQQQEEKQGE